MIIRWIIKFIRFVTSLFTCSETQQKNKAIALATGIVDEIKDINDLWLLTLHPQVSDVVVEYLDNGLIGTVIVFDQQGEGVLLFLTLGSLPGYQYSHDEVLGFTLDKFIQKFT